MDRPDPVLERLLLLSPEARADRQALRLGEMAVGPRRHIRGRRRPVLAPPDGLELEFSTDIVTEKIEALKARLRQHKQPLFDQFTKGYRVKPDKDAIERYCTAANARNGRLTSDSRTIDEKRSDLRRQTQNVADNLEQETFSNWLLARLWRQSLRTTQMSLAAGKPQDPTAARLAADAVRDFGFCLLPQTAKGINHQPSDVQIGTQLIYIGERAVDDTSVLVANPAVLTMVQTEQAKREKFWGERFDFMIRPDVLGDRLVKDDRESQATIELELDRQIAYSLAA